MTSLPSVGPLPRRELARHLGLAPRLRDVLLAMVQTRANGVYSRNTARTHVDSHHRYDQTRRWRVWVALACWPTLIDLAASTIMGWIAASPSHAVTEIKPVRRNAGEWAGYMLTPGQRPRSSFSDQECYWLWGLSSSGLCSPGACGHLSRLRGVCRTTTCGPRGPDLPDEERGGPGAPDASATSGGDLLAGRILRPPATRRSCRQPDRIDPGTAGQRHFGPVNFVMRARTPDLSVKYARPPFGFRMVDEQRRLMVRSWPSSSPSAKPLRPGSTR